MVHTTSTMGEVKMEDDKGIAIGIYELAFLADLVASYLFEITRHHFKNTLFYGIYRDNRIVIFKEKTLMNKQLNGLLISRQQSINWQKPISSNLQHQCG